MLAGWNGTDNAQWVRGLLALVLVITGLAHTAVHVADVEAAVAWYRDVLGLVVLSPPYRMEGDAITRDMGELVPVAGRREGRDRRRRRQSDRVIEVIEYPDGRRGRAAVRVGDASRLHAHRAAVRRRGRDAAPTRG